MNFVPLLPALLLAADPTFPPLPTPAASLGATSAGGYLYVYGGHAGKTHSYDTTTALGTFQRLKLADGAKWEDLPGGPKAQGLNLAAHGGAVYRVGGMQPRNEPGQPADNHSLPDCARFDPAAGKWADLPPLPAGRSSHDVVAVGDKLVVVGGWQMRGKGESEVWFDTALVLDLAAKGAKWESVPQPFKRRALTAAEHAGKVVVIGGLTAGGKSVPAVDLFDPATGKWTEGPRLPGGEQVGFSPAACAVNGRAVVATSDGVVYRLTDAVDAWEKVGTASKRMVARLVPMGSDALLVGGAAHGGDKAAIEVVKLAEKGEKVSAAGK